MKTATNGKHMVFVKGGRFAMGSDDWYPEERPVREVSVGDLWVDEHPVTNAEFRRFVKATGYVTVVPCRSWSRPYAQKRPGPGWGHRRALSYSSRWTR